MLICYLYLVPTGHGIPKYDLKRFIVKGPLPPDLKPPSIICSSHKLSSWDHARRVSWYHTRLRSGDHTTLVGTRVSSPPRYKPLRIKKNPLLAECEEGVSILNQCAHRDLNLGPADYESDALTN